MNKENGSSGQEVAPKKDFNKILDDLGVPVGVKRAAAFLVLGSMLAGGVGIASTYGPKPVDNNIGPDPNLSCPGDFDVKKGVEMSGALKEYLGLTTVGFGTELGDDGVAEFDNGQLRLLKEYKGGKPIGVRGWAFTDKSGKVHSGSIQFSEKAPAVVCMDK